MPCPLIWQTHARSMTTLRALDRRAALSSHAISPRGADKPTDEPALISHSVKLSSQHGHSEVAGRRRVSCPRSNADSPSVSKHWQCSSSKLVYTAMQRALGWSRGVQGGPSSKLVIQDSDCSCYRHLPGGKRRALAAPDMPERFTDAGLWRWHRKQEHPVYATSNNEYGEARADSRQQLRR